MRFLRYTGFIPEIKDVIAQTPVLSQESVFEPPEFTFLNERNKPPVKNHENDCLTEEAKAAMKKGLPLGEAVNLWPNKQESPRPGTSSRPSSARPQEVHVRHGDKRIRVRANLVTNWCSATLYFALLFLGSTANLPKTPDKPPLHATDSLASDATVAEMASTLYDLRMVHEMNN